MNACPDDEDKMREEGGEPPSRAKEGRVVSMHEGVPIWHDSCSCEAEPYWCEAMGEGEGRPQEDDQSDAAEGAAKQGDSGPG